MIKRVKSIFRKATDVFSNDLMVLLMAFLAAISIICLNEVNFQSKGINFFYLKFAIVSMLGISVMFALNMLSQRIGKRMLLELLGVAFLVSYFFILPKSEKDFTDHYAFLLFPTALLSHLLVSFIPFIGDRRELNFWQYNKNLFINIVLTAIFTGVLTGGVELAILAVDKLFDFNFNYRIYLHTFSFLAVFGSCFIFLLFNEKGLSYLERDSNYPIILKFFTQYILIPLLLIYAVILYFYSAKILIHWQLPRGWVSYLILAYSVVGILALLLVHPLKEISAKSWVRVFSKIFYYTLVPLVILLFIAIFTRILAYGYTEPRYFVLLLALWLGSVVLYFVLAKKTTIKYIPLSLFLFGLFSLLMPYFNTFAVAKRSQKTELDKVLTQNQLLDKGTVNFSKKVSDTVADDISNKFYFLAQRGEQDYLYSLLKPSEKKLLSKSINSKDFGSIEPLIRAQFKDTKITKNNWDNQAVFISKNQFYSVKDYDFMMLVTSFNNAEMKIDNDVFTVSEEYNPSRDLVISLNGKEKWNLESSFLNLVKEHASEEPKDIELPEIALEHDLGDYHLKLLFSNLTITKEKNNLFYFNNAYLLIRKKK